MRGKDPRDGSACPDLTDFQLEVTRLFFSLPASKGFLLGGGAALLAQHLTTRPTEDLDSSPPRTAATRLGPLCSGSRSTEAGLGHGAIHDSDTFCLAIIRGDTAEVVTVLPGYGIRLSLHRCRAQAGSKNSPGASCSRSTGRDPCRRCAPGARMSSWPARPRAFGPFARLCGLLGQHLACPCVVARSLVLAGSMRGSGEQVRGCVPVSSPPSG